MKKQDYDDDHSAYYDYVDRIDRTSRQTIDEEHEYSKDEGKGSPAARKEKKKKRKKEKKDFLVYLMNCAERLTTASTLFLSTQPPAVSTRHPVNPYFIVSIKLRVDRYP
jgi:hypothetical protein